MRRFILFFLFFIASTEAAYAHTRSQSYSVWNVDGSHANIIFVVDNRRVTQLSQLYDTQGTLEDLLIAHLRESIRVSQNGAPCLQTPFSLIATNEATLRVVGKFICPQDISNTTTSATVSAFNAVSPTHMHIARLEASSETVDILLREGASQFSLTKPAPPDTFSGFVAVGFTHVLSGLDHLLFLAALILVAPRLRLAFFCITGFTLGHTASLALTSFGLIMPNETLVEAMIGFTIALTALDAGIRYGLNRQTAMTAFAAFTILIVIIPIGLSGAILLPGLALGIFAAFYGRVHERYIDTFTPYLTAVFGLIHGAGFAGGLQSLNLLQNEILVPLVGFNIGVELAQLLTLILLYCLGFLASQYLSESRAKLTQLAASGIFAMGVYWFALRIWGG